MDDSKGRSSKRLKVVAAVSVWQGGEEVLEGEGNGWIFGPIGEMLDDPSELAVVTIDSKIMIAPH